jgi:hypothetical protein
MANRGLRGLSRTTDQNGSSGASVHSTIGSRSPDRDKTADTSAAAANADITKANGAIMNWKLPKYLLELADHLVAEDQEQWASVCQEACEEILTWRDKELGNRHAEPAIEEGDRANG